MSDPAQPASVLVIDDDSAIRDSLRILLGRRGFTFVEASTGAEGFSRFLEHRPRIVMCDMVMPGGEGVETITRIREIDPQVAIIGMSGSIEGRSEGFLSRALIAGANLCLEKPFDADALMAALAKLSVG